MLVRSVLAKTKSGHSRVFDCFNISLSINRARVHSLAQLIGGVFVLSLLASKEPEYAVFVRAYSLVVSLLLQGWSEKYDRTNNQFFASMIVAKYREKPCGGDFSLHPQDLTLQAIKATAIPLPDRIWLRSFWKNLLADRLAKPFLALLWYHFPSVVEFHVRFCSC